MEIWEINLIGKGVYLYFPRWIQQTHKDSFLELDPRGPPAFKMEMKQQKPQEEEIPIWAMLALKISRKTAVGDINLTISPLGDK